VAEDNDSASKTEEPTGRKLEQAREKGDVPKTTDLPQLAAFAAVAGVLAFAGGMLSRQLLVDLTPFIQNPDGMDLSPAGATVLGWELGGAMLPLLLIVAGAAMVAGILGHVLQTGLMWSPSLLEFKPSKLSPIQGFQRLFGVDALIQFVKSLLKLCAVGVIAFFVLRPHWNELRQLPSVDVVALMPMTFDILKDLVLMVCCFLAAIAALDWLILRMQRSRQMMMASVPNATVVVMNPTHYAVALSYEEGDAAAPTCVAKGLDALALRIRAVAEEAGVPVVEDPPLARALYAAVEIDEQIPIAQYEAVAKVIGFVLAGRRRFSAAR